MFSKYIWSFIFIVSIILMLIFISGYFISLSITAPKESRDESVFIDTLPSNKQNHDDIPAVPSLLVLGDSIAMGIGDSTGMDLGTRYATTYKEEKWHIVNLSVAGSETKAWVEYLQEDLYRHSVQSSSLIFISLCGNDLKKIVTSTTLLSQSEYDLLLTSYLDDLKIILGTIILFNPDTQVVFLGLYIPYGNAIEMQKIQFAFKWHYKTQILIEEYPTMVYIPLYDLFKYHLNDYLSADDFHPSSKGYQAIVERIHAVITTISE
ncbi:MAG: hypothetical protein JW702_01710 [Clostridiales bacterium]|nr:hypothetical protein [Clostridiales bacterium]